MHIMHVIDSLSVGGAERMLVELANQTAADGHQVSICVTRSDCRLAGELRQEIMLWTLRRHNRFELPALKKFAYLVKSQKVDLIHAHGRTTLAFLVLVKTLRLINLPIIFHDHYGLVELDTSIPFWFRYWGGFYVSHYVGVYSKLGAWAQLAQISKNKITVIENAIDLDPICKSSPANIRKEFNISDDIPIGIVTCGIRREKGIDILLEALAQSSWAEKVKILVVGGERDTPYFRTCNALRNALGLEKKVIFLGERLDARNLFHEVDFALIPSLSESGPLVLIEYMASGLPFVSTLVGGISHRVFESGGQEFVPPGDARSFSEALDRLLNLTPRERRARGKIGQEIAKSSFDIKHQMPRWYNLYKTVLAS